MSFLRPDLWLDDVCAPGYPGRKRGEVVRTRTTVSQAHRYQWRGSFGNRGNGHYREELRKGLAAITRSLTAHQLAREGTLLRLDGHYGTGAVLSDLGGFAFARVVAGEPCVLKGACTVRRGVIGSVPK